MAGTGASGGRNKKSVAALVLRGTFRKDRHAGRTTPEPLPGRPVPPAWLTDSDALAAFADVVRCLEASGALSVVDGAVLAEYAELHAEVRQLARDAAANEKLARKLTRATAALHDADLVEAVGHIAKLRALVDASLRARRQGHLALRTFLVECGLTPAARSRVTLPSGPRAMTKVEAFKRSEGGR